MEQVLTRHWWLWTTAILAVIAAASGLLTGCSSSQGSPLPAVRGPAKPSPDQPPGDEAVAVVAETKYYVSGVIEDTEMELFKEADPKRMWKVSDFILEVIRPPKYAGQIIGMRHDGVLASGNPYKLWPIGQRYEFRVSRSLIGKLSFGPCSVGGVRKAVPKEGGIGMSVYAERCSNPPWHLTGPPLPIFQEPTSARGPGSLQL